MVKAYNLDWLEERVKIAAKIKAQALDNATFTDKDFGGVLIQNGCLSAVFHGVTYGEGWTSEIEIPEEDLHLSPADLGGKYQIERDELDKQKRERLIKEKQEEKQTKSAMLRKLAAELGLAVVELKM